MFARSMFSRGHGNIERLLPIFDNVDIENRYFCVPAEWFEQDHTFPEKNALYVEHALELSEVLVPQVALLSSELSGAALPLAEALDRRRVPIIWLCPRSGCETGRTEAAEADPRRCLAREASSATVLDSVRAALRG